MALRRLVQTTFCRGFVGVEDTGIEDPDAGG